jgi:DNA-binding SARP family transcriptional activator
VSESAHLAPHLRRLLGRIESAETPVVRVWGWPGSGKSILLEALLGRQGPGATALALGDLADAAALRRSMEEAAARRATWLVAVGTPDRCIGEAIRCLRPGQRLVIAGALRWNPEVDVPWTVLPPRELLLEEGEVASLWSLTTGGRADPRPLWSATDGWYRPLRLALEATGGAGLERPTPDDLLDLPAVRDFLRHQVWESFEPEQREALLAAGAQGARRDVREPLEARGLWLDAPGGERLPVLFSSFLERVRERRRQTASAARPAAAEEGRERPTYSVSLLGSPLARVRDERGVRPVEFRLRRAFQVLAHLASSPDMQAGRDELMEAVWPTEGERTIERNFHPTLSHLRRALEAGAKDREPALLFKSGVYRLNPDYAWEVDVHQLQRRIEEGRRRAEAGDLEAAAGSWREAWRLYRGPFLQGHYEAWVEARREEYQRVYQELLRELGDLLIRIGLADEALDAYRALLLEDPLQERVHLAVMRIYAEQGRRDLVRRQHDRLCGLLLEELGVAPLPETTEEYHRLME